MLVLYDHIDLRVSNLGEIRLLYDALLPAMGFSHIVADPDSVCYYRPGGDRSNPFLGLVLDSLHRPNGTRVALRASDRLEVDRLAEIARFAGAAAFDLRTSATSTRPSTMRRFSKIATATSSKSATAKSPQRPRSVDFVQGWERWAEVYLRRNRGPKFTLSAGEGRQRHGRNQSFLEIVLACMKSSR